MKKHRLISFLSGEFNFVLKLLSMPKCTRLQCGRPAMKGSKTHKCNFHGGKSTGPRTAEGRQRISKANLVHGDETVQMRLERQQ